MSKLYEVGSVKFDFYDNSQKETLGNSSDFRRIAVRLFYPVEPSSVEGKSKGPYVTPECAGAIMRSFGISKAAFKKSVAFYYENIPMIEGMKFPLVLFSHGYSSFLESSSILCSDIASRGYIVASIGHPYEGMISEYEDGTVVYFDKSINKKMYKTGFFHVLNAQNKLLKLKGSLEEIADCFDKFQHENTPWMTERVNVWVKDSLGALKEIKERYSEYIDFTNGIAASGHSYGGDTAYRLALECDEVSCACNIDGALFGYKKSDVLTKPFYTFCCKENWNCESQFIINSKARCYSALFSKMKHIGFTDIKFFVKLGFLVGALDANVMHKHLLEGHMFMLDKYLKKVDCELNKSSSKFVEISECNRND